MYSQGLYAPLFPGQLDPADRPFARMPYQGYEIFRTADRGAWWHLVQPGAEGYGLAATLLVESENCLHDVTGGSRIPVHEWIVRHNDGRPYLLPSLVRWKSCTGPDRMALEGLPEAFVDAVVPVVHIDEISSIADRPEAVNGIAPRTEGQFVDEGWTGPDQYVTGSAWNPDMRALVLESSPEHAARDRGEEYEPPVHPVLGRLACLWPVWSVVPLDPKTALQVHDWIGDQREELATEMFDMCSCQVDWFFDEESVCEVQMDLTWNNLAGSGQGPDDHIWPVEPLGGRFCSCGEGASPVAIRERLLDLRPDFGSLLPEPFNRAWAHLTSTYSDGWRVVDDAAREGKTWATSWQPLFCPYSDSSGRARMGRPLESSTPSTTSESRLAS